MTRIALIQGHPDPEVAHYGHALADAYAEAARAAGHTVERIDVARLAFAPLRSHDEWVGPPPPDIFAAQQAIARCEHLVIVYPLWMGAPPALLQAFFEHVFREGFAVEPAARAGQLPKRLLKGRSARIVVTMGMPAAVYRWFFFAHSLRNLKRNVLGLCGIGPIRDTLIGGVGDASGDAARAKGLDTVRALGRAGR
jgi:putative NADPH-quinone reductase